MTAKAVMACIDGSPSSIAVCDYSAWASVRLASPLTLVHILEGASQAPPDLSGNIGLSTRENLLATLTEQDSSLRRLARENGRFLLEAALHRLDDLGIVHPKAIQRYGALVDSLEALADKTQLFVIGRLGEEHEAPARHIGSNVESILRTLPRPVLVATGAYIKPQRFLLPFDGSPGSYCDLERLKQCRLLKGLECHLLLTHKMSMEQSSKLDRAADQLKQVGFTVHTGMRRGSLATVLEEYCQEHFINLVAVGSYGRSRLHQLLTGSPSTNLMRWAKRSLLLFH